MSELARLDPRLLNDIGLTPWDVEAMKVGHYPRAEAVHAPTREKAPAAATLSTLPTPESTGVGETENADTARAA